MQLSETVRRFTYSSFAGACIRGLGLRKVMQSAYAGLLGNPDAVRLSLRGAEAMFASCTPHELRCVESTWYSEREMLGGVLSRLRDGDVFLDVGSNLGMFSIFAAKVVGPGGVVIAFEPETLAHCRLVKNIGLNGLGNIKHFKMALSDGRAMKRLVLGDPEALSQSAHVADEEGPSEVVESVDYDWLAVNYSLPVPRVVKMDIEGYEFAALRGMRVALSNPLCTALFCEVHPLGLPDGIGIDDVIRLANTYGFDFVQSQKRGEQVHVVATKTSVSA